MDVNQDEDVSPHVHAFGQDFKKYCVFLYSYCKYSDGMKNMNISNLGLKCGTLNIFSNI